MNQRVIDFFLKDNLNKSLIIVLITIFSLNVFFMGWDYLDVSMGKLGFFYGWFSVNSEYNPPAFFNGLLFLIPPFRIFQLQKVTKWSFVEKWGWLIIALVFIFLSLDEVFMIHENQPSSWSLGSGNWFKYYLMAFGVLCLPCFPLFIRLPHRSKILFIVSGVVFLSGAVGLESASIYFSSNQMWRMHKLAAVVEEFLEMFGLIIFSCSLVDLKKIKKIGF